MEKQKKLLATVEIYLEPESTDASYHQQTNPRKHEIVIRKGQGDTAVTTKSQFQSALAHELGHLVGYVSRDAEHHPLHNLAAQATHNAEFVLPMERKAWMWAEEMIGKEIDSKFAAACLKSYEDGARPMNHNANQDDKSEPGTWFWMGSFVLLMVMAVISAYIEVFAFGDMSAHLAEVLR